MQYPSGLLTIDLNALQANWLHLKQQLAAGSACGAVVKADAYGLGMVPVANALHQVGCQHFFVVNLTEGVTLRRVLGDGATIFLLQGVAPGQEAEAVQHGLTPVLVSHEMVQRWLAFAASQAYAQYPVAVKTNTGMHRLGLEPEELDELMSEGAFARLHCCLLMSHLACADEPGHPLNGHQLHLFQTQLTRIRQLSPHTKGSLANSAATLQGGAWHFDLVRPGIALYGANPTGLPAHDMEPVVHLQLPVVQARTVAAGAAVGYGATYIAQQQRHLITVAGGYGDGLFRSLSGRGSVWHQQLLPMVGRVSMDSFVVDVSAVEDRARPKINQYVEVIGPHLKLDEVANAAGTVAYEVLTRLTGRYSRRFRLGENLLVEADFH
jgi:alanine racemase